MNLLEILFPSTDNEQSDAIYGQHLFGKFRHDIFKEDIPPEENTAAENKLWKALGSYYSWNEKQGLKNNGTQKLYWHEGEAHQIGWHSKSKKRRRRRCL